MSRDEVLQYVETFTKVGGDRVLDDRAVGLGHQAAHAGQLTNLRRRTPGAGIRHDEDRVERFLLHLVALGIDDSFLADLVHHRACDPVVGARPDIDDLVVTLAGGHQARGPLLLDILDQGLGGPDQLGLLLGHDHVVDADRDARLGRVVIAGIHQLVGEDNRILETDLAVTGIDEPGYSLLVEGLVDQRERQAFGQHFAQDRAADRGLDQAAGFDPLALVVAMVFGYAALDACLQFDRVAVIGAQRFLGVGEDHTLAEHIDLVAGHVIQTEDDILGRHDDRFAVGRR